MFGQSSLDFGLFSIPGVADPPPSPQPHLPFRIESDDWLFGRVYRPMRTRGFGPQTVPRGGGSAREYFLTISFFRICDQFSFKPTGQPHPPSRGIVTDWRSEKVGLWNSSRLPPGVGKKCMHPAVATLHCFVTPLEVHRRAVASPRGSPHTGACNPRPPNFLSPHAYVIHKINSGFWTRPFFWPPTIFCGGGSLPLTWRELIHFHSSVVFIICRSS